MGVNTTKLVGYALLDGGLTITQAVSASSLGVDPHAQSVDKLRAASLVEPDPTYLFTTKALGYSLRQDYDPITGGKLTGQSLIGPGPSAMPGAKLVAYTLYTDQFAPIRGEKLIAQSQEGVGPDQRTVDKLLALTQIAVAPRQTTVSKAAAYALLDDGMEPDSAPQARRFGLLMAQAQADAPTTINADLLLGDGTYALLGDGATRIQITERRPDMVHITLRGRSTTRGTVTYRLTHHEPPPPNRIALEVSPQGSQPLIRLEDGSYFLSETQPVKRYNDPKSDV